jgi:hypothetical protein
VVRRAKPLISGFAKPSKQSCIFPQHHRVSARPVFRDYAAAMNCAATAEIRDNYESRFPTTVSALLEELSQPLGRGKNYFAACFSQNSVTAPFADYAADRK